MKIGRFVALMNGRQLIKPTKQPFFNSARQLLAEGVALDTVLTARYDGSTTIAMRSTVGEAARWRWLNFQVDYDRHPGRSWLGDRPGGGGVAGIKRQNVWQIVGKGAGT